MAATALDYSTSSQICSHGSRDLVQLLYFLQPAAGPRTPIRIVSLAPSAYDVARGGGDLLIASPFADDLVVSIVAGRGLERSGRGFCTGKVRG